MSRPLRIEIAGGFYHVTSRGDGREDIYYDEADRVAWLDQFAKVCQRFNWQCHGWCQMTNHYHIIVQTKNSNLSQGMRQLNGVYTQYINRRYQRVGHVFQGRYKAILVEQDSYLLELSRYVVLNPVRAGLVTDAEQWPWSAYAAMTGAVTTPVWLQTDWILGQFGQLPKEATSRYRDFVRAGMGRPSVWEGLRGQIYLGSDVFLEEMQTLTSEPMSEIPHTQRRPLARPLLEYLEMYGNCREGMAAAYASGDYTMHAIALVFGVHYATVSRAVRQNETPSAKLSDCKT